MRFTQLSGNVVPLSPPRLHGEGLVEPIIGPQDGVLEPYAAIDPGDPLRAAVVAVYPNEGADFNRGMWCWQTADGGQSWNRGGRVPQPKFDGEGIGDPLVGYGPDGALVAVAIVVPKAFVDSFNARPPLTRVTSPTIVEDLQGCEAEPELEKSEQGVGRSDSEANGGPTDSVCVTRSGDHGQTWSGAIAPNSGGVDKEELVIDNWPGSPFAGHLYLAWQNHENRLTFARSVDGGRSVELPFTLAGRNGIACNSIAVGPDGTVHLVWHWSLYCAPDAEDEKASTGLFYARSDDGGASFSEPVVIAEHDGPNLGHVISMAAAPSGALLVAWGEADGPVPARGLQTRTTVKWIHSKDGVRWSEPALLSEIADDDAQALPAVAATDRSSHVLSYDGTPTTMTVRIYSADQENPIFQPTRDLATRAFGWDDLYLCGIYMRLASDICIVGDYVGLAAAGDRLAAAFVLPVDDDWRSTLTVYAAGLKE